MPMKSYDDGTIVHIDHAAGDEVALGQRVMVLAKKGEDPKQVAASLGWAAARRKAAAAGKPSAAVGGRRAPRPRRPPPRRPRRRPTPPPTDPAATASRPPTRQRHRRRGAGRRPAAQGQPAGAEAGRVVQRRPRPGARLGPRRPDRPPRRRGITSSDSRKRRGRDRRAGRAPRPRPAGPPATARRAGPAGRRPARRRRIPHSRMRKTIAQRMVQAKQAAPEIHLTVDIRADRLVAAREELNKRLAREGIKLSLGDFVTKAVAMALRPHPGVNASFEPDAIVRHGEVNIGIAVALARGPDRPGPPSRRYPGPPRDPHAERGPGRRGAVQ